jgi:hypothetical protein
MRQAGMIDAADQLNKSGEPSKVAGRRQQETANRPSGKSGTGTLVGSMVSSESIVWNRLLGPDALRYDTVSCCIFGHGISGLKDS